MPWRDRASRSPCSFASMCSTGCAHFFRSRSVNPARSIRALWERTARVAAQECAVEGIDLNFSPMIDVARDPRWGRTVEGPGEDAFLAARFAKAKVRGFQASDLSAEGAVAATAKHLAAYGAVQAGREYAPVDMSERQFHEVYLPPFRAAVQAGVAAIMPAFTDFNGTPMTANAAVLRDIVRRQWGFSGVMISDYSAIAELIAHGVARDKAEAAALRAKRRRRHRHDGSRHLFRGTAARLGTRSCEARHNRRGGEACASTQGETRPLRGSVPALRHAKRDRRRSRTARAQGARL